MMRAPHGVLLMGDTLNLGGTEGQFVEVACGLDRARWRLEVGCIRAEGPLRARLTAAGIEPWTCNGTSFSSPRFISTILSLARRMRASRVDLAHSFDFYSNLLVLPAARLARVPVIIASQRDLGELRPRHQHHVHGAALRLATHVLVNSSAVADRLSGSRAGRSGRVTVIHNGVDLRRFAPEGASPISGTLRVGVLASLRGYKGMRELVEAAAEVKRSAPHVRFVIWGEGPLRPEIESRIQALGLSDTVRLAGVTREPEAALRQCQIFVHPSLSEASSNVVLEAMATGLPIVATTAGGTPALVQHGQSGLLVAPGSAAALADAVLSLVTDRALAARLGTAARLRATSEFGMARMIERVEALYLQALGVDPQPSIGVGAVVRS